VVVNGAAVQSFTPSTPNQGFTPQPSNNPPNTPPPQALVINSTNPIILDPSSTSPTPADNITIEDEAEVNNGDQHFKVNASDPNTTPQDFAVQVTALPTLGTLCAPNTSTVSPCPTGYAPVVQNQAYPKNTDFVYHTAQTNETVGTPVTDSFTTQAVSSGHGQPSSAPTQVPVNIVDTTAVG
jgi:hypothetical protein